MEHKILRAHFIDLSVPVVDGGIQLPFLLPPHIHHHQPPCVFGGYGGGIEKGGGRGYMGGWSEVGAGRGSE